MDEKSDRVEKEEKLLTVIIPFLNEGDEVERTVRSIREHSRGEVDILLINDASEDGYAYEEVARRYAADYIRNEERIGVAASRDKGVARSRTPYVLFLDAHMRFYTDDWVGRIVEELKADSRALLCCQTLGLHVVEGEIVRNRKRPPSFGAYVHLYDPLRYFECSWLFEEGEKTACPDTLLIPCVLGATYACAKTYWLHLKGLQGLMFYGNDESYISIKVWLEGGRCKLLKDVAVGHIYRDAPPYIIENAPRLYNRLLLAELLLPDAAKARVFSTTRKHYPTIFRSSVDILYRRRAEIGTLKEYYRGLFKNEFSYFEDLNKRYAPFELLRTEKDSLLKEIAGYLAVNNHLAEGPGLVNGKLGVVIYLFEYARYADQPVYAQLAELLLDQVMEAMSSVACPDSFNDGIYGFGWGIEYLYQRGFVLCDTNEVLEEIDRKAMAFPLDATDDFSSDRGMGGVLRYVWARLYTLEKERKANPFPPDFLSGLYEQAKAACERGAHTACPETGWRYILFFEQIAAFPQPSVYDIAYLTLPDDYEIEKYSIGIDGSAGVGLKLLFEDYK